MKEKQEIFVKMQRTVGIYFVLGMNIEYLGLLFVRDEYRVFRTTFCKG